MPRFWVDDLGIHVEGNDGSEIVYHGAYIKGASVPKFESEENGKVHELDLETCPINDLPVIPSSDPCPSSSVG